jgi:Fe-S-cluster containining protein
LVLLNPWELHRLASEKQLTTREFRDHFCDWSGIRLKFEGPKDARGKKACSQYIANFGCSVHASRPLACRLFPLGRQIQNEKVQYIHQGSSFPCLEGCSEVLQLPHLTVKSYLNEQKTGLYENAQDGYLEVMQNMADIAFMLFLDTGLAESGDIETLSEWNKIGAETPNEMALRIGSVWMDYILLPPIKFSATNPSKFSNEHQTFLQEKAQQKIDTLTTLTAVKEASIWMMAIALFLAKSIGADTKELSELWVEMAKKHI